MRRREMTRWARSSRRRHGLIDIDADPSRVVDLERPDFACSLNKMRTRGCRVKPICEILRFVSHQSFAEFHDAHSVRWYSVIGKYEFSDPEIAAADNSPDRKTLLVRLDESALLNVASATDPLTRDFCCGRCGFHHCVHRLRVLAEHHGACRQPRGARFG